MNPDLFQKKKDVLVAKLTGILLEALESGNIFFEDGQDIAATLLAAKEQIKTDEELDLLVTILSNGWPAFTAYAAVYKKGELVSKEDEEKLSHVKSQLAKLSQVVN